MSLIQSVNVETGGINFPPVTLYSISICTMSSVGNNSPVFMIRDSQMKTATATMTIRDAVLSHPTPILMIGSNRTYCIGDVAYRVYGHAALAMLWPVFYADGQWVHINQKYLLKDYDTIITLIQD